jgi:Phage integrase family
MPSSDKPRFFIEKRTKRNVIYYWQPSAALRKLGHHQRRLPDDRGKAIEKCHEINAAIESENERERSRPSAIVKAGTVSALIRDFKDNHRYRARSRKTRQGYDQNLRIIERHFGDVPVKHVTRPVLEKFYNKMHKRTPWQANAVLTMFRRILFFAMDLGLIVVNPASKMERAGDKPRREKWEDDVLEVFLRTAKRIRRSIWLATVCGAELGQREADILELRREDLSVKGFYVVQNKGGVIVEVPCSERLREALAEIADEPGYLIKSETTGRPYKGHNFTHVFAEIREAAGIEGLRYQDLRRTCVVNLAYAGCTPSEISAVTGHRIDRVVDILETYLPRDSQMAANAIAKLDQWRSERSKRARERERQAEEARAKREAAEAPPSGSDRR